MPAKKKNKKKGKSGVGAGSSVKPVSSNFELVDALTGAVDALQIVLGTVPLLKIIALSHTNKAIHSGFTALGRTRAAVAQAYMFGQAVGGRQHKARTLKDWLMPACIRMACGKYFNAAERMQRVITINAVPAAGPPLRRPSQVTFAPDGTILLVDTCRWVVYHLSATGDLIKIIGTDPDHRPDNYIEDSPIEQAIFVLPKAVAVFGDMVIVGDNPNKPSGDNDAYDSYGDEESKAESQVWIPTRLVELKLSDGSFVRVLPDEDNRYTSHGSIEALCFSPDGLTLAVANSPGDPYDSYDDCMHLLSLDSSNELSHEDISFHCEHPCGMVFTADGKHLAVAENNPGDWGVRLYATHTGEQTGFIKANQYCRGVAIDPLGNILMLDQETVRVYSRAARRFLHNKLVGIKMSGQSLAFDNNSGRVAVTDAAYSCDPGPNQGPKLHILG